MKANQIYVGINGATLGGFSAGKGLAVYPVQKGGKKSYVLLDSGKLGVIEGARINGIGVPRWLANNGFELAKPGDEAAAKLADMLDVREGSEFVSSAMGQYASELQKKFGGVVCNFVPFDPNKPVRQVEVEANCISTLLCFGLQSQFNSARVKMAYKPGDGVMDVDLSEGWLVGPDFAPSTLPRLNEARELIEYAVYVICNSGLGTLVGAQNLAANDNMSADGVFYMGPLEIALTNGDRLLVGGTSDDLLATQYLRNDVVLYQRVEAISAPKLGSVVGDIAAVLVRVAEMDAEPAKKKVKKAA